ncbi:hypothetical protein DYY67_2068 [Candidatus Nitrosotalea sp. TS]|nr:hypothetical protein [Candidatus Nitrosotalea sp. TS]
MEQKSEKNFVWKFTAIACGGLHSSILGRILLKCTFARRAAKVVGLATVV